MSQPILAQGVKDYREVAFIPKSEAALETKAFNNLQSALHNFKDELEEFVPFIRTLIEDIRDYKTLPKSTLRRFANVSPDSANFKNEIQKVRINLGDDYLEIIKKRLGTLKSEVIIAIENQSARE